MEYPSKYILIVFLFCKEKELFTSEGCVEMDIPWQLCRTIGPLLGQRFPLASAKAQPRGGELLIQYLAGFVVRENTRYLNLEISQQCLGHY